MSADPIAVALALARVLERDGVRYVLGGSLASVAFGEPRATQDVDLAVDLTSATIGPFLASVTSEFMVDEQWARAEVARRGSFQLLHRETMFRVDLFVPEWSGFDAWKWRHRRRIQVGDEGELDVTSPEGIVLQKLIWFLKGGEVSDRQWRDVLGVLKGQRGRLDLGLLRERAAMSEIAELLERALAEAGTRQ